jgi:hypothetical protein
MLAAPSWRSGHLLAFGGFVAMTAGVWMWSRHAPRAVRTVTLIALAASALQSLEMFIHAMADVDLASLRTGASTPVLSTHMAMTAVIYPIFGLSIIAFIVATARNTLLGSKWIAWIGIAGAAMHGAAGLLVVAFEIEWARELFPGIVLLALWLILAGLWPTPRAARHQLAA